MSLPWIKMWIEALDDPKLIRLSLAERGAWWGLLKLAEKCEAHGKVVSGSQGMDIEEIADALHIKLNGDREALASMIEKMIERDSLIWNQKTLTIINFERRQKKSPSSDPAAVAERVRNYRERQKLSGKKGPNLDHMVATTADDVKRIKGA